jgi:5-methylcytosine-specific restriction enzyme subunit McrC
MILRSMSFDLGHGDVPATAFLVDMNRVFEEFIVHALREAIGPGHGELVQGARGRSLHLDEGRSVRLLPDLSLWQGGRCVWVGDVKYKRVALLDYPNADIYQATAYAIATGLDALSPAPRASAAWTPTPPPSASGWAVAVTGRHRPSWPDPRYR